MKQKPIIAVDIDDVLSSSAQAIVDYGNAKWGYQHTVEDFTEHLATMWQVDADEAERRWLEFMSSGQHGRFIVIPVAKDALVQLKSNYILYAVTSRRDELLPITQEWLDSNYSGIIDRLIGAGIYGRNRPDAHSLTKAGILKEIGADFLIDDQPKHCLGAAEAGVDAVLFGDYPWQRDIDLPSGVRRCKTWQEVLSYFNG